MSAVAEAANTVSTVGTDLESGVQILLPSKNTNRINTKAINGLRGLVALHVMVHHEFGYSTLQIDGLGSVDMSFFFLMSGFILALNDGSKNYYQKDLDCKCCHKSSSDSENKFSPSPYEDKIDFNSFNFYQRRFARTMPLFYLTNVIAIPLWFLGYCPTFDQLWYQILSVSLVPFAANTWFAVPFVTNGPAWFVSTIWFFYWLFPYLITRLQNKFNDGINMVGVTARVYKYIWIFFILQLVIAEVLYYLFHYVILPTSLQFAAFNIATFWPVSRIFVFIMGMLGGLLRLQNSSNITDDDYWIKSIGRCESLFYLLFFVVLYAVGIYADKVTENATLLFLHLQVVLCYPMLKWIYVLSLDDESIIYKFLSSKVMIEVGRISYSLYLIHWPIIFWMCWFIHGTQSEPDCSYDDCKDEWNTYYENQELTPIQIPIHFAISIVAAFVLNRLFEEPMRKLMRPKN